MFAAPIVGDYRGKLYARLNLPVSLQAKSYNYCNLFISCSFTTI